MKIYDVQDLLERYHEYVNKLSRQEQFEAAATLQRFIDDPDCVVTLRLQPPLNQKLSSYRDHYIKFREMGLLAFYHKSRRHRNGTTYRFVHVKASWLLEHLRTQRLVEKALLN